MMTAADAQDACAALAEARRQLEFVKAARDMMLQIEAEVLESIAENRPIRRKPSLTVVK